MSIVELRLSAHSFTVFTTLMLLGLFFFWAGPGRNRISTSSLVLRVAKMMRLEDDDECGGGLARL